MSKGNWRKYIAESLLIVFSVLLALFLNQVIENRKLINQKEIVLSSIEKEINSNLQAVKHLQEKHQRYYHTVREIRIGENDSLKNELLEADFFNAGVITNGEPVVDQFISNTSWQTAQSIGIVSEFDYALVEKLTLVYALQDILMNQTLDAITETLFERETHNMNNIDETLVQLELRFNEIVGQEYYMIELLKEASAYLEESR